MTSTWFDRLFLHGYVTDRRWPLERARSAHRSGETNSHAQRICEVPNYLRRCLGIGDGVMRKQ
ncbi:hypothetical protein [Dyella acidisoli]|uniref:hypothetical protein n=1 Tax=Dyella acidisoli TaxID=1867834 RepID=UPI0024E139B3|nr:hypothetical protein [Dyella acidisoli]